MTGGFPSQWTSNAENVSIWWRHHGETALFPGCPWQGPIKHNGCEGRLREYQGFIIPPCQENITIMWLHSMWYSTDCAYCLNPEWLAIHTSTYNKLFHAIRFIYDPHIFAPLVRYFCVTIILTYTTVWTERKWYKAQWELFSKCHKRMTFVFSWIFIVHY